MTLGYCFDKLAPSSREENDSLCPFSKTINISHLWQEKFSRIFAFAPPPDKEQANNTGGGADWAKMDYLIPSKGTLWSTMIPSILNSRNHEYAGDDTLSTKKVGPPQFTTYQTR